MASKRQDGLLALSEIWQTSPSFSFHEENDPSTGKSQQFRYYSDLEMLPAMSISGPLHLNPGRRAERPMS